VKQFRRSGIALVVPGAIIVAAPALTWLVVHGRGWETKWVFAALSLALTGSVALAGLVGSELARRRETADAVPAPERLSPELLERWRGAVLEMVSRMRVEDGGQLATMIGWGDPIDVDAARVDHDSGRPRVRVGDRLLPWPEIKHRWDSSPGRLVILGDPGYGKTVAALTLIKHINARDEPGAIVAELFPLAEWQRWRGEHQTSRFATGWQSSSRPCIRRCR
jgi:hypothetical protein